MQLTSSSLDTLPGVSPYRFSKVDAHAKSRKYRQMIVASGKKSADGLVFLNAPSPAEDDSIRIKGRTFTFILAHLQSIGRGHFWEHGRYRLPVRMALSSSLVDSDHPVVDDQ
jgi:hypothetical protein